MADVIEVVASVSDRDLSAVQAGHEIVHNGTLADLMLLADTLGIRPRDLRVRGVVGTPASTPRRE